MEWAALVAWVFAALGGFVMLGIWLRGDGAGAGSGPRIPPASLFSHAGLAAAGLALWIGYLVADSRWMAWVAFGAVLVVALIGFAMLAAWLQRRRARGAEGAGAGEPPEQSFPVGIVAGHGVLGAATLVLVLLTALEIGT